MCEDCKGKNFIWYIKKVFAANTEISEIQKVTERGKKGQLNSTYWALQKPKRNLAK